MTDRHEPAYRHIADELSARILSGKLQEGDRLPSIKEMMASYGVAKATVERALAELRSRGLTVARPGAGVFVRRYRTIRRSSPGRLARERWGSGLAIQDADTEERPRVVDVVVATVPAPEWVATALGLEDGAPVLSRSRRFLIDDRPVQLATSYYPAELVRGSRIVETDTGPGGSYARLAELGHAPHHFTEYVRARHPVAEEVARLELPPSTPVLEITRHAHTEAGQCVEVNRMILDATAYLVDYSFPA